MRNKLVQAPPVLIIRRLNSKKSTQADKRQCFCFYRPWGCKPPCLFQSANWGENRVNYRSCAVLVGYKVYWEAKLNFRMFEEKRHFGNWGKFEYKFKMRELLRMNFLELWFWVHSLVFNLYVNLWFDLIYWMVSLGWWRCKERKVELILFRLLYWYVVRMESLV